MFRITAALKAPGHVGPLLLLAAISLYWFWDPGLEQLLIYDRALLDRGQLWRLFSGHLAHAGTQHLMLNSAGLTLLWLLHGSHYTTGNFFAAVTLIALGCSLGLYFFSPATQLYLGLSGVLHGMAIWGGYRDLLAGGRAGYLLVAVIWIKVVREQMKGANESMAELIGVPVAIDAHFWGAAAGSLLCLGMLAWRHLVREFAKPQLNTD